MQKKERTILPRFYGKVTTTTTKIKRDPFQQNHLSHPIILPEAGGLICSWNSPILIIE